MADDGRRGAGRDKRTEILRAVWAVIARGGIAAVSVRNVAAEAGVSPGRVQHYFPTKELLVRASAEEMITQAEHRLDEDSSGAGERLWALLAHAIPVAEGSPTGTSVFYSYVAAGVADPDIAGILAEAKDGAERKASDLLVRLGVLEGDALARARSLVALADGLTLRVLVGGLAAEQAEQVLRAELEAALGGM